jgi:hypothetical protein
MAQVWRVPRIALVAATFVATLAFSSVAYTQESVEVTLSEQNGSGITGTAMLEDMGDGTTQVTVTLDGAGAGPQPIHIHPGTCATLDPKPVFPLTNVMNGESITVVEASLADIQAAQHAINVHKSPEEAAVYVACGDIAMMAATGGAAATETPEETMAEATTEEETAPETEEMAPETTDGAMEGGAGPGKLPASGSDTTNWLLVSLLGVLGLGGLGAGAWLRSRAVKA